MNQRIHLIRFAFLIAVVMAIFSVTLAGAVESPPTGTPPNEFARNNKGCLGTLRSEIAKGNFAGVGPFGEHFTGDVNPGAHQGTVGEEEFLRDVIGIEDIESFCEQFE